MSHFDDDDFEDDEFRPGIVEKTTIARIDTVGEVPFDFVDPRDFGWSRPSEAIEGFFGHFFRIHRPPFAPPGLFRFQKDLIDKYLRLDGKPSRQRVMIQVARDHGKSTMLDMMCAYILLVRPLSRIFFISADDRLAVNNVKSVHNLLSDDHLIDLIKKPVIAGGKAYGGKKGSQSSMKKSPRRVDQFMTIPALDTASPSIQAFTVGGADPTGHRADYTFKDDVVRLSDFESEAREEKVTSFMSEVVGTTEPTFDDYVVGTPKWIGDYYHRLLASGKYSNIRLPAMSFMPEYQITAEVQSDGRVLNHYSVVGPRPICLCPEKWTCELLLEKIDEPDMGLKRFMAEYMLEYQWNWDAAVFDTTKVHLYDDSDHVPLPEAKAFKAVFDPTTSVEANVDGDHCALVVGCRVAEEVYIDYIFRGHLGYEEQLLMLSDFTKEGSKVWLEDVGFQSHIIKDLRKLCPTRTVKAFKLPKGKKRSRISSILDPVINAGHLHVRREYVDALRVEADTWRGKPTEADDVLDALASLVHLLRTGGTKFLPIDYRI